MSTEQQTLEQLVAEAQQLSPEDRLRLIQRVAETLIPASAPSRGRGLVYGEFKGERMSTEEDFAIAEWRPTEQDLNGS